MLNIAAALAVAVSMWGLPHGCERVQPVVANLPPPIVGYATVGHGCRFKYAARIRRQRTLCWTFKHELGHLHGKRHSRKYGDIMLAQMPSPPRRYCLP